MNFLSPGLKQALKYIIPILFVFWMLVSLYLTLFPSELLIERSKMHHPKIGHVILFGGWTFLLGLTQIFSRGKYTQPLWVVFLAGVAFGASVELLQFVLPFDRQGSIIDIGYNTIGSTIAIIMLILLRNWYVSRYKKPELIGNPE